MCFGPHRRRRSEEREADSGATVVANDSTGNNIGETDADYDKVLNDAQEFANSFGSLAKSMFEYGSNTVLNWHDQAHEKAEKWHEKKWEKWDSEFARAKEETRRKLDDYFPRPYELRESDRPEDVARGAGFGAFRGFWQSAFGNEGDNFSGGFSSGKTPFGYFSYGNPSIRAYNDCMDKQGQSVWDSNGYWRCLFPQREVEIKYLNYKDKYLPGQILTKEDLERAANDHGVSTSDSKIDLGHKGTFFSKYDDFLNWKSIMYENVKRDRKQRRDQWLAQREKYVSERNQQENVQAAELVATTPNVVAPVNATPVNEAPVVISSSTQSTYNSNSETNQVELNETRTEYFSDGTSVTRNITKSKPFGATEWGNVSEDIVQGTAPSTPEKPTGWFWKD